MRDQVGPGQVLSNLRTRIWVEQPVFGPWSVVTPLFALAVLVGSLVWGFTGTNHDWVAIGVFAVVIAVANRILIRLRDDELVIVCGDLFFLIAFVHLSAPDVAFVIAGASILNLLLPVESWVRACNISAYSYGGAMLANFVLHQFHAPGAVQLLGLMALGYFLQVVPANAQIAIKEMTRPKQLLSADRGRHTLGYELREFVVGEGPLLLVSAPMAMLGVYAYPHASWTLLLVAVPFGLLYYSTHKTVDLEETKAQSRTDVLTGLLNRAGFRERAEEEVARSFEYGHPVAVLLGDLDRFKQVNDTLGHAVGDEVLRVTGQAIKANLNDLVRLSSRYGGEEFAVLVPARSELEVLTIAETIREEVETQLRQWGSTISIGVAWIEGTGLDEALERADQALYAAKRNGRNQVFHWAAITQGPIRVSGGDPRLDGARKYEELPAIIDDASEDAQAA